MQVDLIITELDVGGAEQTLARLAIGLQRLGDDVRVYSLGPLPQAIQGGEDRIVAQLNEHQIPVRSGEATGIGSLPRLAWDLRSWLGQRSGAIRQSFLFHANVLTNCVDTVPVRMGWRFAGIRVAENRGSRLRLERHALRRAAKIVCVSSAVQSFAHRHLGVASNRTTVIPNSVNVDRFVSAKPIDWTSIGWPADAKVVLFVGRFHEQKNLGLLKQALDSFAPEGKHVRLLLIGDGPQRENLQCWADQVSGDRVRILPWQPDVAPFMAACEVLVLPSLYEGMPNVVMEAMASGKPVVCSRVEGSAELIGDDVTQMFDRDDRGEMIERLNRLIDDPASAEKTGQRNRQRMLDSFSVDTMVNAYRTLYLDACQ